MANYKARDYLDTPTELITNGKFNYGTFNGAIKNVNPLDAYGVYPLPLPLPRFILNSRLKEWQAFQMGNDDYFILAVLYNTKTVALTQFKIYNKKNRQLLEYQKMIPPWEVKLANTLLDSEIAWSNNNYQLTFHNKLNSGLFDIDITTNEFEGLPNLRGNFRGFHSEASPLVVAMPFEKNQGMYSHKSVMKMKGTLLIGSEQVDFTKDSSFMIVDDHKAYYPFEMKYDWVTAAGSANGKLIGFNLTDNQVSDHSKYNENALWIGKEIHLLPPIKFERPDGVENSWQIKDNFGIVDICFKPEVENNVLFNLGILKSDYYGPFGTFEGFIKNQNGNKISVDNFFGMGEQKLIRA